MIYDSIHYSHLVSTARTLTSLIHLPGGAHNPKFLARRAGRASRPLIRADWWWPCPMMMCRCS